MQNQHGYPQNPPTYVESQGMQHNFRLPYVETQGMQPGVHMVQLHNTVNVTNVSRNQVAPRRIIAHQEEQIERTCCEKAWHCDGGKWYSPGGKGPAWIPFYIILWILIIALGACFIVIVLIILCISFCPSEEVVVVRRY